MLRKTSFGIKQCVLIGVITYSFIFSVFAASVEDNYEKAVLSFQNKNYSETIIHLKNVIAKRPKHLAAHVLFVETYLAQNNGALAETELVVAHDLGVDASRLVTLYAQSYFLQEKYKKLFALSAAALKSKSAKSTLLVFKGKGFIALNQFEQAKDYFEQALILTPFSATAKIGLVQIYITDNRLDQALALVNEVLNSYEPVIDAWILKSLIQNLQGQPNEALISINQAVKIDPKHLGARVARVSLLVKQKNYALAQQDVDIILTLSPNDPTANLFQAILANIAGNLKDTYDSLLNVVNTIKLLPATELDKNPDYYYFSGLASYTLTNFNEARDYFKKFLAVEPENIQTLVYLAEIELQSGYVASAKNILVKAKLKHPQQHAILALLGKVYAQLGNEYLAKKYLNQAAALNPKSSIDLSNLAGSEIMFGEYKAALISITKALSLTPTDLTLQLMKVEALIKSKQLVAAEQAASKLVIKFSNNSSMYQQRGIIYGMENKHQQAFDDYTMALKLDENNVQALILLTRTEKRLQVNTTSIVARLIQKLKKFSSNINLLLEVAQNYREQRKYSDSLVYLEKAYALDSNSFVIVRSLVEGYWLLADYDNALAVLKKQNDSQPKNEKTLRLLSKTYRYLKQNDEALKALALAARYADKKSYAYMDLAELQIKLFYFEQAEISVQKAIGFDSTLIQARILLVRLYIRSKNEATVLSAIADVAKLTPKLPTAKILTADLYLSLGQFKRAQKLYTASLNKGYTKQALIGLYSVAKKLNQYNLAVKYFKLWLDKNPNEMQISVILAESYKRQGFLKRAEKIYQQLRALNKKSSLLLNNLALIKLQLNQPKSALKLARQAYQQSPDNINYIDTFAWLLGKTGSETKALALYREATALDFDNPTVKYHLAVTLMQLNKAKEARKLLSEIIMVGQEFEQQDSALKLLKTLQVDH